MKRFYAIILTLVVFCGGCSSVPPAELEKQAAAIGYGAPLPADWQATVKAYVGAMLKDPDSATYRFGEPRPGWVAKPPISGGGLDATGYIVAVEVNAKNGYGGYTGFTEMQFLIHDGRVIRHAKRAGEYLFWE
jgi:hypothetical protein